MNSRDAGQAQGAADMPVRAVAAATIGTALEWFDFACRES